MHNRGEPSHRGTQSHPFGKGRDAITVTGLVLFTLAARVAYAPPGMMGFDGPLYVNSLRLDSTFNVPPPGNIGYVWLGKACSLLTDDPVRAYIWAGIVLSCLGVGFTYLFARLVLARWTALGVALCVSTSAMVWYHGLLVQSYIVWLAALPAIGYFGLRFSRERSWPMLIGASLATGISTILRPDLVFFGGPLLGAGLLLGRARIAHWGAGAAICAACCCVWLFGTAYVVGGVGKYIDMLRERQTYHEGFGASGKGMVEGVLRNSVKYGQFLFWSTHIALVPVAVGVLWYLRRMREEWRAWVWAIAWAGPSLAYAIFVFTGAAGFILPVVPLAYVAAAKGLEIWPKAQVAKGPNGSARIAGVVMLGITVVNLAQFTLLRPVRLNDQRRALVNHMFLGYTGPGLRRMYDFQLADFGIDKSLKGTLKQFSRPEPLPIVPERLPPDLRPRGEQR